MKLTIPREDLHQKVYLFSLAILVCCLPLSRYLLSISQFLLLINWLLQGRFRQKVRLALNNPAILFFGSLFLIYCIGLLYTQNLATGLARVKNALPLLLLPLVMGTSKTLSAKEFRLLLLLFSSAVITAAMVCLVNYFITDAPVNGDFREVSIFMLHIRFSLMIVMSMFILLYFLFSKDIPCTISEKLLFLSGACFLAAFLLFLRSFTGIIIGMVLALVFLLNMTFRSKRPLIRHAFLFIIAGTLTGFFVLTLSVYRQNFHAGPVHPDTLEIYTVNGNRYSHDILSGALENGHYIDLYVCETELKKEWNKISRIPYDSLDRKGQSISYTIRRYLTSKGYRKDSAALSKLDGSDIQRIEDGLANYTFRNNPGIYQRLYETLWELHILSRTGYMLQHSMGQRIAFLEASWPVLKENIWTGVGTGDVYDAMLHSAREKRLTVDPQWEGKPHNQFIFFILAFGMAGFLYLLFCFIYPVMANRAYRSLLFNLYAGIILISMLTLDTLESYDSMVFFAFFYCLFVFAADAQGKRKLTAFNKSN